MPLDPNHIHAEVPHERTVHLASQGWRYGCSSARTGDTKPRGGTGPEQIVPDGFAAARQLIWNPVANQEERGIVLSPLGAVIKSDWLPIPCGHTTRATDTACEGCCNRGDT